MVAKSLTGAVVSAILKSLRSFQKVLRDPDFGVFKTCRKTFGGACQPGPRQSGVHMTEKTNETEWLRERCASGDGQFLGTLWRVIVIG